MKVVVAVLAAALVCAASGDAGAKRRTGQLDVKVSVEGAEIAVDGVVVATSPLQKPLTLRTGTHSVKVTKPGHAEFLDVVKISQGEVTTVDVDLIPFAAILKVTSNPPGADVLVDGEPAGVTPLSAELSPGNHTVRVVLDGYAPTERAVKAVAGEAVPLSVTLARLPHGDAGGRGGRRRPVYREWWFWTAASAVVVGVTAIAISASMDDDPLAGADHVTRPPW